MTTYQLLIELAMPLRLRVGRLGECDFPPGRYIYTGSARRNITARVARHLSKGKTLRWHIDYLLANPAARVVRVRYFETGECQLNLATRGAIVTPRFGASDCRAGCQSHLKYAGPLPRRAAPAAARSS